MTEYQVLNWKTDPLLLDAKPESSDTWITANDMLISNTNSILDGLIFSNPYGWIIRKQDFVLHKKNDRILTRFPYLVLSTNELEFIQKNTLVIAQIIRDYFYPVINDKISNWKKRIENYLLRGSIPFPFIRCCLEVSGYPKNITNELMFESAKGKRYTIPIQISKHLAYLCGVINGDGHLHHHWLRVIDETKEHIQLISKLFIKLFSDPGKIFQT